MLRRLAKTEVLIVDDFGMEVLIDADTESRAEDVHYVAISRARQEARIVHPS